MPVNALACYFSSHIFHKEFWCLPIEKFQPLSQWSNQGTLWVLTHWGRVTHICVNKLSIIGSDNGLSPDRRQAIIWTNAGILLIGPLVTNFSEILIEILTFSLKKMCLKVSPAKRQPFLSRPQCVKIIIFLFISGELLHTEPKRIQEVLQGLILNEITN